MILAVLLCPKNEMKMNIIKQEDFLKRHVQAIQD